MSQTCLIQRQRVRQKLKQLLHLTYEEKEQEHHITIENHYNWTTLSGVFEQVTKVVASHFLQIKLLGGLEKLLIPMTKSQVSTIVCPLVCFFAALKTEIKIKD